MLKKHDVTGVKSKPSSPREFFKKIYGDLEKAKDIPSNVMVNVNQDHNPDRGSVSSTIKSSLSVNESFGLWRNHVTDQLPGSLQFHKKSYEHEDKRITKEESAEQGSSFIPFPRQLLPFTGQYPILSSIHMDPGLAAFLTRRKRKVGKLRRQRTTFTNEQTVFLENEFKTNEYITRNRRYELAEYLKLTETQIKIWFQNRRAKDKRIEKAQIDQQYRNLFLSQQSILHPAIFRTTIGNIQE